MCDLDKKISEVEKLMAKVAAQAEQEIAMANIMPIRFKKNIEAFEKYIPSIANEYKDYKCIREFEFFCTENGIPNLRWVNENVAIYGADPYLLCKNQIECMLNNTQISQMNFSGNDTNPHDQIHVTYMNQLAGLHRKSNETLKILTGSCGSVPLTIMFGVGLGYQLGYLYERLTSKNLFIFEPDRDVFYASLYTFDWYELLKYIKEKNLGLHIFLGVEEDTLMQDMQSVLLHRGTFLASSILAFMHYPSEYIFKLAEKITQEFYMLNTGWGFFDDNLFAVAHSVENIKRKIPFLLESKRIPQKFEKTPIFVIGNGPSLDSAISYIRKHKDNAILISCGSSISALYNAGIKPDICVALERTKGMADFYGIIKEKEYLKDILFFSSDIIHPDCHNYFKQSALCFKKNEPIYMLCSQSFNGINDFSALEFINPVVGNMGLNLPIALGFKEIHLFGLDNGYKDEKHHHSKLSSYYDKNGNPIDELTKIVTKRKGILLPGNFGGHVLANSIFATSAKIMHVLLKKSKNDIICYNHSDGVLIDGAIPCHLDEMEIDDTYIDKAEIIKTIYSDLFGDFPVSVEDIKNKFNSDLFIDVVNNIIHHFDDPIKSREDIIERMQQIHEYVLLLVSDGYAHIYRFLYGSLTYMFSSVSVLAYHFSDENETIHLLDDAVKIMVEYLEEMKIKYPHAFDSIDYTASETTKFHRKI